MPRYASWSHVACAAWPSYAVPLKPKRCTLARGPAAARLLVRATLPPKGLECDARPEDYDRESRSHRDDDYRREHCRTLEAQLEDERRQPDQRRTGDC